MKKDLIIISLVFSAMLLITCSNVFAQTASEKLSVIDRNEHSKEQFQTILNILKRHHPEYSEEEIANLIAYAYNRLQEEFPDITIYDVASGILENSKILLDEADLKQIVALYIASYLTEKTYGY